MALDTDSPVAREYMSPLTVSVGRGQTLAFAAARMEEHKIRHLPVLDGGQLLGVLSDRDINWLAAMPTIDPETMTVNEAMTDLPYTVDPDTPLESVVREMERHKYGAAIVVEGNHPVGIFTTVDAMRLCGDLLERLKSR